MQQFSFHLFKKKICQFILKMSMKMLELPLLALSVNLSGDPYITTKPAPLSLEMSTYIIIYSKLMQILFKQSVEQVSRPAHFSL